MSASRHPGGAFAAFYAIVVAAGFGLLLVSTPTHGAAFTPILLLWLLLTMLTDANPVHLPNGGYRSRAHV